MISVEAPGSFKKTDDFLAKMQREDLARRLDRYGRMGVDALSSATPVDSGETAQSWTYTISQKKGSVELVWHNTNVHDGIPIAIILQYGHGTGTGGWVPGRDYINPAIRPIFDQITADMWSEVTNG
jgi:hypothetical protein